MPEPLKVILAIVLALALGYMMGHWRGEKDGRTIEAANHVVTQAKQADEAVHDREVIDDHVRKLPKSAVDTELSDNGWLRD